MSFFDVRPEVETSVGWQPSDPAHRPVTVVIPTFNKPTNLYATLNFLVACDPEIQIIICDGTIGEDAELVRAVCLSSPARLRYFNHPSPFSTTEGRDKEKYSRICQNYIDRVGIGCLMVDTPYMVLGADDDLLVTRNLLRMAEYLDHHPEYIGCDGPMLGFSQSHDAPDAVTLSYTEFPSPTLDGDTPETRFMQYFSNYRALNYIVFRPALYAEVLRRSRPMYSGLFSETCFGGVMSQFGKIKRSDVIVTMRNMSVPAHPLPFEWASWSARSPDEVWAAYHLFRAEMLDVRRTLGGSDAELSAFEQLVNIMFPYYFMRHFDVLGWIANLVQMPRVDTVKLVQAFPLLFGTELKGALAEQKATYDRLRNAYYLASNTAPGAYVTTPPRTLVGSLGGYRITAPHPHSAFVSETEWNLAFGDQSGSLMPVV